MIAAPAPAPTRPGLLTVTPWCSCPDRPSSSYERVDCELSRMDWSAGRELGLSGDEIVLNLT
jgi:hypothetical protein